MSLKMILFFVILVFLLIIIIVLNYKISERFCSSDACDKDILTKDILTKDILTKDTLTKDTLTNYSINPDYTAPIYKYATAEYDDITVLSGFSKTSYTSEPEEELVDETKAELTKPTGLYGIKDEYTINSDRRDICLIYQDSFANAYDNIPDRVMNQFINWCHEYVNITDEFPVYRTAEKALHILLRKDKPDIVLPEG